MQSSNDPITVAMRASRAPVWSMCQRRAGAEERAEKPTGPQLAKPVAIEFGDRLHQMVTGHEITREPRSVAYDEYTPTKRHFDRQLAIAYDEAQRALESYEVIATEYALECDFKVHLTEDMTVTVKTSCHVDLVLRNLQESSKVLLDLKSSRLLPYVAWPQLALNTAIDEHTGEGEKPDWAGILWISRTGAHKKPGGVEFLRRGEGLAGEGRQIVRARAVAAAFGENPSPSRDGCSICDVVDCGLRAQTLEG